MIFRLVLGAVACFAGAGGVSAHAVLDRTEAPAGSTYRGVVRIAHGCKGAPTTSVSVTIPEGVVGARAMPKPGWVLDTKRGPYARAYDGGHGTVSEGVKEITWRGGPLPDDQFDEFTFTARLTDAFRSGDHVAFPVEQVCEGARVSWSEIPPPGGSVDALARPAPRLRILAAADAPVGTPAAAAASPSASTLQAGDLAIDGPWMRATPGGAKVAGGYLRVTNRGKVADRLMGTSIPLAGRGEVHEMSTESGVMKMRPIEGGLVIKPGETVELKPGGYHLMFMDLKVGIREGEPIKGTLVFEKAGTVDVTFQVAPIGASAPKGGHGHH